MLLVETISLDKQFQIGLSITRYAKLDSRECACMGMVWYSPWDWGSNGNCNEKHISMRMRIGMGMISVEVEMLTNIWLKI